MIGQDAMGNLKNSSALIIGMGPVGVETAKNLILAGVNKVAIFDIKATQMNDLSAQVIRKFSLSNFLKEICRFFWKKIQIRINNIIMILKVKSRKKVISL